MTLKNNKAVAIYKDLKGMAKKFAEETGVDIMILYFGDNFIHGIRGDMLLKRIANGCYRDDWKGFRIQLSADKKSVLVVGIRDDGLEMTIGFHDFIL